MSLALMEAPSIVSASNSVKSIKEMRVSVSEEPGLGVPKNNKYVYLFHREYATVDPALIDVLVVGGFEDVSPNVWPKIFSLITDFPEKYLPSQIIEVLHKRRENFHMQTLFILGHNTERDSQGNANPIFKGLLVHKYISETHELRQYPALRVEVRNAIESLHRMRDQRRRRHFS